MCCTKFILFTTNAIIFVLGVIVVGIASAIISRSNEYGELLMDGVVSLPVGILILGLVVCIIGFLGCFGALKESKCMLYTYSGLILVLFIAEITIAILVMINPEGAKEALNKSMESQFQRYGGGDQALDKSIDNMQSNLECCGVNGPTDWKVHTDWEWQSKTNAPWSCCSDKKEQICLSGLAYDKGCSEALIEEFQDIRIALGVAGIVLAIFLFFSMSTACGIAKKQP